MAVCLSDKVIGYFVGGDWLRGSREASIARKPKGMSGYGEPGRWRDGQLDEEIGEILAGIAGGAREASDTRTRRG